MKSKTYAAEEMFLEVEFKVWDVFLDYFHDLLDGVLVDISSSFRAVCSVVMAPFTQSAAICQLQSGRCRDINATIRLATRYIRVWSILGRDLYFLRALTLTASAVTSGPA